MKGESFQDTVNNNNYFTFDAVFFVIHKALTPILTCLQQEKLGRVLKSAGKCGVVELN